MSEELNGTEVQDGVESANSEATKPKRDKKLVKSIDGTVVTIEAIGGVAGAVQFDTALLSDEMKAILIPFGASHKLGDAAAGRTGEDAEKAIQAVWDGLLKGEMTVRQPAAPKVSISKVKDALAGMSAEDAEKARALMAQMGITL